MILPMALRGSASTTTKRSGTLYLARLARQWARSVVLVELGAGAELDHGDDPLAEALVGHADHGAGRDRRHLLEHPLDLGRVDVGPAPDDHEALAVAQVQARRRRRGSRCRRCGARRRPATSAVASGRSQ